MLERVTRSQHKPELEVLLHRFLSTMAEPEKLQQLVEANPRILSPDFDLLMLQTAAVLRNDGHADEAQLVDRYRALLDECRRLGIAGGFIKANAYALIGGFLRSDGPDNKISYLREHPEIHEMVNRAALHQMIEQADEAGNQDLLRFLRSNLLLLDAALMSSPEAAVNRAYGRG